MIPEKGIPTIGSVDANSIELPEEIIAKQVLKTQEKINELINHFEERGSGPGYRASLGVEKMDTSWLEIPND